MACYEPQAQVRLDRGSIAAPLNLDCEYPLSTSEDRHEYVTKWQYDLMLREQYRNQNTQGPYLSIGRPLDTYHAFPRALLMQSCLPAGFEMGTQNPYPEYLCGKIGSQTSMHRNLEIESFAKSETVQTDHPNSAAWSYGVPWILNLEVEAIDRILAWLGEDVVDSDFAATGFVGTPLLTDVPLAIDKHVPWKAASCLPQSGLYTCLTPSPTQSPSTVLPPASPQHWKIHVNTAIVTQNGQLFIELESHERVPVARFEDVFVDALQDNRASPMSMRDVWQMKGQRQRPRITYTGSCSAGVIKSRRSSVFTPLVGSLNGQTCVIVVDDSDQHQDPRFRVLRTSPYLPDTLSTKEPGWLLEAILRRDWSISLGDVMDRMLRCFRKDISTYNRWRRHDRALYEFADRPRPRYAF